MRRFILPILFTLLLTAAACGSDEATRPENPDTPFIRADQLALTAVSDADHNFTVDLPLPRGIRSGDLEYTPGEETPGPNDLAYYQVLLAQLDNHGKSLICQDIASQKCVEATITNDDWQFEAYTINVFPDDAGTPKGGGEDCLDEVDPFNTTVINGKKRRYASCVMIDGARVLSVVVHEEGRFYVLTARGSKGRTLIYTLDFFHSFEPL
jgi:hypothetical protein